MPIAIKHFTATASQGAIGTSAPVTLYTCPAGRIAKVVSLSSSCTASGTASGGGSQFTSTLQRIAAGASLPPQAVQTAVIANGASGSATLSFRGVGDVTDYLVPGQTYAITVAASSGGNTGSISVSATTSIMVIEELAS